MVGVHSHPLVASDAPLGGLLYYSLLNEARATSSRSDLYIESEKSRLGLLSSVQCKLILVD